MGRTCLLFPVAVLATLAVLSAQQNQTLPVFRSRVDVVVLDVSVLDKDRQPVRGLEASDFTVLEDGKPQKITMFSAVEIPDPEEPSAPWMKEVTPDVRRNEDDANSQIIVLLLDDANPMAPGDVLRAKQHARMVIDRLGPRDLAAVAFVADARSGQEFTHDRQRLLAAIDRFSGPAQSKGSVPGALEMLGPSYALNSLKGQAEALQELPAARKAVIFISTRGSALPDALKGVGDAEGLEVLPGMDAAGMDIQNFGEFGRFVRAAQQANLNVYCVDPGGLRAPAVVSNAPSPDRPTSSTTYVHSPNARGVESLQALSVNTGGFAIVHTNDPQPGLTQAFRENRSYYLLAYASSNLRTDGRYRSVQVKVNRDGVVVRTRNGYFEPEAKKNAAPPPSSLSAALTAPIGKGDLPMQVAVAPFASAAKRDATVAVVLGLRHDAQTASDRFAEYEVAVNAYDYTAKLRGSDRFNVRVTMKQGQADEGVFEVLARLDLPPGRYQLRVAASETRHPTTVAPADGVKSGRTGSVFCDLDVPDFRATALSLSGLALNVFPPISKAQTGRVAPMLPIVPTTLRQFISGDHVTAFLRVYQGGGKPPEGVTIAARIIDAATRSVFERSEELAASDFASGRAVDYLLTLPTRDLTPREYLLTIEAKTARHGARRDVRFTVR
ncbi:MAG: VWA domain-containing protein [Bacteroidales bacterium]